MKFFKFPSSKLVVLATTLFLIIFAIGTSILFAQPESPSPTPTYATTPTSTTTTTATAQPSSTYNPTPPPATVARPSSTTGPDIPPEVTQYAADWPLPNKDYASTRATTDSTINSSNVGTLGMAWSMNILGTSDWGGAATTPIIMGNTVYFQDLGYNVYSIALDTGNTNWVNMYNAPFMGPNGVCVGWGKVFATTDNYNLAALDMNTGQEIWNTKLATINQYLKVNAAPLPFGNLVFTSDTFHVTYNIGSGIGYFYALNQSNGAVTWAQSGVDTANVWGHPEINSGGGAWMSPSVDTNTGNLFWGTKNPGNGSGPNGPYSGTLEFPNGSSRPGPNLYTNCVISFNAKTGDMNWYAQAFPHDLYDHDFQNPPILASTTDTDIVIGSGKGGIVFAYNRATGKEIWQTPVGKHQNDNLQQLPDTPSLEVYPGILGGVETMPAYSDGMVFVPYDDIWGKYTSTGLAENQNFNEATGGLAALDVNTGNIVWDNKLPKLCVGAATVVNDLVFTATYDGMIYAFNKQTGATVWSWLAPAGINAWPAVAGDTIIWPAGYGGTPQLMALKLGASSLPTTTPATSPTATSAATTTPTATTSPTSTASPTGQATTIDLVAQNLAFNMSTITVNSGAQVTINFNNKDSGVPHNFSVYTDSTATQSIFAGQIITGPATTTYTFTAPTQAGTYFFRCDVHPSTMTGQFIVQ